jgi:hypothetical protein
VRERRIGPNDIDFSVSIRFPHSDLPTVTTGTSSRRFLNLVD